jgi:phage terminase small subunit
MDNDSDKITQLSPMEEDFCRYYCAPRTDTYSNGTKSAIAAGYSAISAASQASRMVKNPRIRRRIEELSVDVDRERGADDDSAPPKSIGEVMARLNEAWKTARERGDISSEIRALVEQAELFAAQPDEAEIKALTEREQRLASRVSLYLLTHDENSDIVTCPHCGREIAEPQQQAGQGANVPAGNGAHPAAARA